MSLKGGPVMPTPFARVNVKLLKAKSAEDTSILNVLSAVVPFTIRIQTMTTEKINPLIGLEEPK